jgi:hypothetical protein
MTSDLNMHLVLDDLRLVEATRIGTTAWSLTRPCRPGGGWPGPPVGARCRRCRSRLYSGEPAGANQRGRS